MIKKTTIAIGCLVQWYETEIASEYLESLVQAINNTNTDIKVLVDLCICEENPKLENWNKNGDHPNNRVKSLVSNFYSQFPQYTISIDYAFRGFDIEYWTIAKYRQDFNIQYSNKADVLVWGESDMLVPKNFFNCIAELHNAVKDKTPKYVATAGICKMWDESWRSLEHPDFTDKPFIENDVENWWSLRYTNTIADMNKINDQHPNVKVCQIYPHKFNGCGLIISSEVIKAGVNIPQSVFFVHEDTAFLRMFNIVLSNAPQYHFSNLYLPHNRKHPKKRMDIKGEEEFDRQDQGKMRNSHNWYALANKYCEINANNFENPNFIPYTWENVFKKIENE